MSRARTIPPDEASLLAAARAYVSLKLCGNQRIGRAWRELHRAYAAVIRRENREAGMGPRKPVRRVA